jgi:hypothetical protein
MSELRFRARIAIRGINPYVLVSARRANSLRSDWRKPMPVHVQVNGKPRTPSRVNMMPAGDGRFFLYLRGNVRKQANADVGDLVEIRVTFDETYRGGPAEIPAWFASELKSNRRAHDGWKKLPPSRQKEIARYLGQLKSDEAKHRNLRRALDVLAGAAERFMARSWNVD